MSNNNEDPQVNVTHTKDGLPTDPCMTAVMRFTATINCNGENVPVGSAILCVPKNTSQAREGFLLVNVDPIAPDMAMVAQALFEYARMLPESKNCEIVAPYKGALKKMESWIKKNTDDVLVISSPNPQQV